MQTNVIKTKLPLLVICLMLAGCIKNPPTPPGPKPEWLLEKIITTDALRDPNLGTVYSKNIVEYLYRNNKPFRCNYYYNTYEGDTNNLVLTGIDSFLYDNHGRVKQVNTYNVNPQGLTRIVKHYYSNNDRLPSKIEYYQKDSANPSTSFRYSYTDTSVIVIIPYYKGGFDTTIYSFDTRGNYVRQYFSRPSFPIVPGGYDNAPNPALFLQVENAQVFTPQLGTDWLSRFSKNNWTIINSQNWDGPRIITLNEYGMVIKTVLTHNIGPHDKPQYISRYEYRHAD